MELYIIRNTTHLWMILVLKEIKEIVGEALWKTGDESQNAWSNYK